MSPLEIADIAFIKKNNQNKIVKIIKANRDIFSEFIMHNFNKGISTARFADILKSA